MMPVSPLSPSGNSCFRKEYLPAPHDKHVLDAVAPMDAEYLPEPQFVQVLATEAPVDAEYMPEPQFVQVLATEAPVVTRNLPAPQAVHAIEPMVSLYFPAAHAVHSGKVRVYPLLHLQLSEEVCCMSGFTEFDKQAVQRAVEVVVLYVFGSHGEHVVVVPPVTLQVRLKPSLFTS
jgi:hypothetical protein